MNNIKYITDVAVFIVAAALSDPWSAPSDTPVAAAAATNGSPWASPPGGASNGGPNNKPPGGIDDEFDLLSSRSKSPPNTTSSKIDEGGTENHSRIFVTLFYMIMNIL